MRSLFGLHGKIPFIRTNAVSRWATSLVRVQVARPILQKKDANQTDHPRQRKVNSNRGGRPIRLIEPHGDKRRRTAGSYRGKLVAERGSAVPARSRTAFRDERRLRSVLPLLNSQGTQNCYKDPTSRFGVE